MHDEVHGWTWSVSGRLVHHHLDNQTIHEYIFGGHYCFLHPFVMDIFTLRPCSEVGHDVNMISSTLSTALKV